MGNRLRRGTRARRRDRRGPPRGKGRGRRLRISARSGATGPPAPIRFRGRIREGCREGRCKSHASTTRLRRSLTRTRFHSPQAVDAPLASALLPEPYHPRELNDVAEMKREIRGAGGGRRGPLPAQRATRPESAQCLGNDRRAAAPEPDGTRRAVRRGRCGGAGALGGGGARPGRRGAQKWKASPSEGPRRRVGRPTVSSRSSPRSKRRALRNPLARPSTCSSLTRSRACRER